MWELMTANITADLAYYRRSRLLLAFMLVFLLMICLQTLPPLFTDSGVQKFNTLQDILSGLNFFVMVLCAGLGLFIMSSHLRSRNLKMVFTKPCSPAVWLASAFATAVLVALLLNVIVYASTMALSYIWKVPVRTGLFFVSIETFVVSIGLIAYLVLLGTVVHPALAATVAVIFNSDLFYSAEFWARSTVAAGNDGWFLRTLIKVFHFLYLALPMFQPFASKTQNIHTSLRVEHGDWKYLAYSLGYVLVLSLFCYSLALFALLKRKHI